MEKKEFERLRLTTQMTEMVHTINTSPYQSQKDQAKKVLQAIQEQYKAKFGEYSQAHIITEAAQYATTSVAELIATLEELRKKHGDACPIEVKGTLMCQKDGNSVILSTEKQM